MTTDANTDPTGADKVADAAFAARLRDAAERGELVTHYDSPPCPLGLWHEGPCPPDSNT